MSGKIGGNRSPTDSSGAGDQSITLGQSSWNPLKKLSVAGDEAVRDTGASPQKNLASQAKKPELMPELIENHQGTLYREGGNCNSPGGAEESI